MENFDETFAPRIRTYHELVPRTGDYAPYGSLYQGDDDDWLEYGLDYAGVSTQAVPENDAPENGPMSVPDARLVMTLVVFVISLWGAKPESDFLAVGDFRHPAVRDAVARARADDPRKVEENLAGRKPRAVVMLTGGRFFLVGCEPEELRSLMKKAGYRF